jgi:hypothetical protein
MRLSIEAKQLDRTLGRRSHGMDRCVHFSFTKCIHNSDTGFAQAPGYRIGRT